MKDRGTNSDIANLSMSLTNSGETRRNQHQQIDESHFDKMIPPPRIVETAGVIHTRNKSRPN